jgi:hypothetical protein
LGELELGDRNLWDASQNQLAELSEENRRLREIVAYLSEVVLTRIAETIEPAGQSGGAETQ